MQPNEALQYLSAVAADFARTLPPSSQGPTVQAINVALATLQPIVEEASKPRALSVELDEAGKPRPHLAAVPPPAPGEGAAPPV